MRKILVSGLKSLVVKIGSSILTPENKGLDERLIAGLVNQIQRLLKKNIQVIIVSSGAIGTGMKILGLSRRPGGIPQQQAAAAIGQARLMEAYDKHFKKAGFKTAQILLTREDLINRRRYLNAKNTLLTTFEYGAVPIVNENDTVAVEEIKFGDNDCLSALVANLIEADLLIILSNIDGFYRDFEAKIVIKEVKNITPEIEKSAGDTEGTSSVGGMKSKLEAAKIVTTSGIPCVVASGREKEVLTKIIEGKEIGTLFVARSDKLKAKKRWIGFSSRVGGGLVVDMGAKKALITGKKSLLPKGLVGIKGKFGAGETVQVLDVAGKQFAKGLCNYNSEDLEKIKGKKTCEIKKILGRKECDEIVHRDNLVIL